MDDLWAHRGDRVRELIEGRGCELLYLPAYSPDLNPIDEAFSTTKGRLRKAEARSREALIEAMGGALDAITPRDARGSFGHCGYRVPGHRYDRRSRGSDLGGQRKGCSGLLRTRRIPSTCPTFMKHAV